jgi:hypothetical protein
VDRSSLLHDLAWTDEHLAQNLRNIVEQEQRAKAREAAGIDASSSRRLLRTFKDVRASYYVRRDAILRQIAALPIG